jgi:hypothetical protein
MIASVTRNTDSLPEDYRKDEPEPLSPEIQKASLRTPSKKDEPDRHYGAYQVSVNAAYDVVERKRTRI